MSLLRQQVVGRTSVSVLALAVVAALAILTHASAGATDGSSVSRSQVSFTQPSSELGVVSATPRASFGVSELERDDRTGFGPLALLLVVAGVFTLIATGVRLPSDSCSAVQRLVGPNLARAPPVTPAV